MSRPTLTRIERLDLLLGFFTAVTKTVIAAVLFPFQGPDRSPTLGQHVQTNFIRALSSRLSIAQLQYIRGTSTKNFNKWAATHGDVGVLSTEVLSEGAKIHWIGRRNNKIVIFHVHANCPQARYPTQFRQANIALRHLIQSGIKPANIILSADSAGGHIALCLISHILHHAHPAIDPPPVLFTPLGGILLISPRVSNSTTASSFHTNSQRDTLTRDTLATWISAFREDSPISTEEGLRADGFYTEPAYAPPEWWDGFTAKVARRMFISAGSNECFRDAITAFADSMIGVPALDVSFMLEEKGIHDSPLMDVRRKPSDLVKAIRLWLAQTVQEIEGR